MVERSSFDRRWPFIFHAERSTKRLRTALDWVQARFFDDFLQGNQNGVPVSKPQTSNLPSKTHTSSHRLQSPPQTKILKRLEVSSMPPPDDHPLLLLAPMEGVMDWRMRDIICGLGSIDMCVSEFVRVVNLTLPKHSFLKLCPELCNDSKTSDGTPMRVQLLGQDPSAMAANAARAVTMGSPGVDINFGCPAKTVNRHGGGASLLAYPDLMQQIVSTVRQAVPSEFPVTAKMRLGCDDASEAVECAQALADGGAHWIVVHGRTRAQGYRPPVDWESIGRIRESVAIRVIANGDINCPDSYARCRAISGCKDAMIGRGVLVVPNLAEVIQHGAQPLAWAQVCQLMRRYAGYQQEHQADRYLSGRLKQWMKYLCGHYPEARNAFVGARLCKDGESIMALAEQAIIPSTEH